MKVNYLWFLFPVLNVIKGVNIAREIVDIIYKIGLLWHYLYARRRFVGIALKELQLSSLEATCALRR